MPRSMNVVYLLGHLGKDAELRYTPSGAAVANFSLATSRRWKDKQSGEYREETDWHNIVSWNAEKIAQYLTKGKAVLITGRLQTRSYEAKDGSKRYVTEVVADELRLLGGDSEGKCKREVDTLPHDPGPRENAPIDDSDVPF
jgi:single-strand DNA-binding protein